MLAVFRIHQLLLCFSPNREVAFSKNELCVLSRYLLYYQNAIWDYVVWVPIIHALNMKLRFIWLTSNTHVQITLSLLILCWSRARRKPCVVALICFFCHSVVDHMWTGIPDLSIHKHILCKNGNDFSFFYLWVEGSRKNHL